MKLVREDINERFTEEADPIQSMGIGLIHKLKEEYVKLHTWRRVTIDQVTIDDLLSMCLSDQKHPLSTVEALIDAGANITAKGNPYLRMAVRKGLPFVKLLIEKGATPKMDNSECFSSAMFARNYEIGEYLLSKGANINAGGSQALKRAVSRNDTTAAKWLLERGANPNSYGFYCLRESLKRKNLELSDIFAKEYVKARNLQ